MKAELKRFIQHAPVTPSLWYVASPYSHPEAAVRAKRVLAVRKCVLKMINDFDRVVPFSPVLYTVDFLSDMERPPEGWYRFDLAFLRKADRLVVLQLDGWETSMGIAIEIAFAESRGLPIGYYTVEELLSGEVSF